MDRVRMLLRQDTCESTISREVLTRNKSKRIKILRRISRRL